MPQIPKGTWPRAALYTVALQAILGVALESLILREHILRIAMDHDQNALSTPNVIYPILYIFGIVWLLVLCVDALYYQNQIQVVAFTIFNILCCAYGVLQTTSDWMTPGVTPLLKALDVAISVTMGVGSLFLILAAWKLAAVFGWEMYRFLGADLNMRKMHKGYEILMTFLKLDVFFFVAFAVQLFTLVGTISDPLANLPNGVTLTRHQLLLGLAIPGSMILLGLSFFGYMRENKIASVIVMVCLSAAEPYFVYQLIEVHRPMNFDRFINSRKYLTFFISVTMVLVLVTLFFMVYCFRNFGKGLLISSCSKVASVYRRPFEIDEDVVVESVPSLNGSGDDGATQRLMAYPALKKIQETYKVDVQSAGSSRMSTSSHQSQPLKPYNDKMEIE
ncbi:hypothetical protein BGW38_001227 [Lunasporangiospora selenospora]|uniref:Uncharacterized protein n=1 Tax=Lunasporangiospora selenospora TaxID=979761 RepID=A0A9P6FU73_9FUNG|nr:hypothetical protein BGW38_001227 [Lunasporangiospora selenospora]